MKAREIVSEEWQRAVEEFELRPGSVTEKVVARIINRLDEETDTGTVYEIAHDGFRGTVIGSYTTRDGKEGVVLQQIGSKVVHVYGKQWLKPWSTLR